MDYELIQRSLMGDAESLVDSDEIEQALNDQGFRDFCINKACESFIEMNRAQLGRELRLRMWHANWDTEHVDLILRQGRQHPEMAQRLARLAGGFRGKRVLEVGCGYGRSAVEMAKLGADVSALDVDYRYLSIAKLTAMGQGIWPGKHIQFYQCAAECLPYPTDYFDVIWSDQTIEHVQDVARSLKEMVRVLKPGGIGVVRCPNYLRMREPHFDMFWPPFLPRSFYRAHLAREYRKRYRKFPRRADYPPETEQIIVGEVVDELGYINFIKPFQVAYIMNSISACDWRFVRVPFVPSQQAWKTLAKLVYRTLAFDVWRKGSVFFAITKGARLSDVLGGDVGELWCEKLEPEA